MKPKIEGDFLQDTVSKTLYATDASAYREIPDAVAIPKTEEDLRNLVVFCHENKLGLIPRAAGTSLAGQVVGKGVVVDISKHFTEILEIDDAEKWVRVQPGVNRDELNYILAKHNLYFGPETSTSNRCRLGGMVGNNSCGSNSVMYGSTREHLIEARCLLADGSIATFGELTLAEFEAKCRGERVVSPLEQQIYLHTKTLLSNPDNAKEIRAQFPKAEVPRRNTGYAIDMLLETEPFTEGKAKFNFCKLIAGSEGTLCLLLDMKLGLVDAPPKTVALVCPHFETVDESLRANLIALKYMPYAVELMDRHVLEATKSNREQKQNLFFVQGMPNAILMIELKGQDETAMKSQAEDLINELKEAGLGYHFPVIWNEDTKKAWNLRKAGLGLLANIPGDEKAVPVIEDTAVDVEDLPAYIREFNAILKEKYNKECVHYAHAGSGELHLRPILNLKTKEGNQQFRDILEDVALLVKKYKGSLSGEHGDGRLRGEFIRTMIGDSCYAMLESVKKAWDPMNLFNPNKIVDTPPMNESLRYTPGQITKTFETFFDYPESDGYMRMTEKCNGSGDCRKSHIIGGTMCPSYMATKDERHTTRARANILREFLTHSDQDNPFAHDEIKEVMDLCLSCKGCKSECPSNVDIAKLKADWQAQYYKEKGIPFRSWMVSRFSMLNKVAKPIYPLYNFFFGENAIGKIGKQLAGFHPERSMPKLHAETAKAWFKKNKANNFGQEPLKNLSTIYLLIDEFTHFNDVEMGKTAIRLLARLGYTLELVEIEETGRSAFSKGLLEYAKGISQKNVNALHGKITAQTPLIGLEPSALLCFRDEYIDILRGEEKAKASEIGEHSFLLEEFLELEMAKGNLSYELFTEEKKVVYYHGHCMQKAHSSLTSPKKVLQLPLNYEVRMVPSGCCGMAGSFGYEKEHFQTSMDIGELVLLPAARKARPKDIICAPGTSCRHQIKDGAQKIALHPVEVLWQALKP